MTTRWLCSVGSILVAAAAACGGGPSDVQRPVPRAAPHFALAPDGDLLSGDPVQIAIAGLAPGEVEIVAERPVTQPWDPSGARTLYRARASFRVGADGRLDLAGAAPVAGSYAGADLRGLFWSMAPTEDPIAGGWADPQVRLIASQRGAVVARAALTLQPSDPKVELTPVGPELPGAVLARLPGAVRRPAIIVLGGSEGGDWFARTMSPRLAWHGYAVLGLPYYAPAFGGPPRDDLKGLPSAFVDIPVDRLDRARDWLRRQPGVDADRIAVYGVSKGAEFALIAAARLPWLTAVIAIVPTDVVWEGWGLPDQPAGRRSSFAWRGEPLPFVPYHDLMAEIAKGRTGGQAHLRRPQDEGRAQHPEAAAAARIPIERYRGALLIAGGGDDQVWASGPMTETLARTRAAAGLATTALVFADAGHALSGDGWSPTTQIGRAPFAIGGTPAATARAQAEVWRETLAVLARALSPETALQ
ncbi:MAG TPA: acyl-CoA thioester hydrolase/BAAT C-terminal domain-containing protein [Kofleriaceae bacterium]|nr:acyl-CoA thioester hydrolase/BAAT C-terminal domain-containing protein [Kofleriaceae bacterium]